MKVCTKCKEEKESHDFYTSKRGKDGLNSWCKKCFNVWHKAYAKKYYQKNKRKICLQQIVWRSANKKKILGYAKKYRDANRENCIELSKLCNKKKIDQLDRSYIIQLIKCGTKLETSDIPQELIEVKRVHLQLIRTLKGGTLNGQH